MPQTGSDLQTKRLQNAALTYRELGYSLIPILGDQSANNPKQPAADWKAYQYRRPSESLINQWFAEKQFPALAIITGSISNLLVLDFDDPQLAAEFETQFPDLLQTRIVQSAGRKLPHYYFHLPTGTSIPSRQLKGLDILSDGRYVIAPPSIINGSSYQVLRGGSPKRITNAEISRILRFADQQGVNTQPSQITHQKRRNSQIVDLPSPQHTVGQISPDQIIPIYRALAPQIGRNNALFRVSLHARDAGLSADWLISALAQIHADQPSTQSTKPETQRGRYQEALRTIRSAFSRDAQRRIRKHASNSKGLPNSVREKFLQDKQTAVVRVLDGLLLKGILPRQIISQSQAVELLKDLIGRYSVLKALKEKFANDMPIFQPLDPSPRPPSHADAALGSKADNNNKCLLLRETASDKNKKGRPCKHYLMPDIQYLCKQLDVPLLGSDALSETDLVGADKYRKAIHREFIRRNPGIYSRGWLAGRLGISGRTCQRYNKQDVLKVMPVYEGERITWNNLNRIPDGDPLPGTFLQDEDRKRYPPLKSIARRLLAQKRTVTFMRQTANFYAAVADEKLSTSTATKVGQISPQKGAFRGFTPDMVKQYPPPAKTAKISEIQPPPEITTAYSTREQCAFHVPQNQNTSSKNRASAYKLKPKRYYRQPLPDTSDEKFVTELLERVNNLCANPAQKLSRINARKITDCYRRSNVIYIIQIVERKAHLQNPVGLLLSCLRSTAKSRGEPYLENLY